MLLSRRYRAPAGDGEILADSPFEQVPELLERARWFDLPGRPFGGMTFSEWRRLARREVLDQSRRYHDSVGEPFPKTESDTWIVAGHQPDVFHPGVWLKNFALAGLARGTGSLALNLIVDNDAARSPAVRVPRWRPGAAPESVGVTTLPFDAAPGGVPFEEWTVRDEQLFRSFPRRLDELTKGWGFQPIAGRFWEAARARNVNSVGLRFALSRRALEREWGAHNLELPVSWLCVTSSFRLFADAILADLQRFHAAYNAAVAANHAVPGLAPGEAPFWVWRPGDTRRARLFGPPEPGYKLRPRALTLTLFARLALADVFIHGIGGGKYDELTDAIAAEFFGAAPPPYLVVSGTLRLPLPGYPAAPDEVGAAGRRERDMMWNPQRHVDGGPLAAERGRLIGERPDTRIGRRRRYAALRHNLDEYRPLVATAAAAARADSERSEAIARANAILRSREYAFVLYPEDQLRAWLEKARRDAEGTVARRG